jgi:hypothetical protein
VASANGSLTRIQPWLNGRAQSQACRTSLRSRASTSLKQPVVEERRLRNRQRTPDVRGGRQALKARGEIKLRAPSCFCGQLFATARLGQLGLLSPFECELVLSAISYVSSGVFQSRPREAQLSAKSNSERIAAARKSRGPE